MSARGGPPDWAEGRARLAAPIFAPYLSAIARLPADRWPAAAELSAAAEGIRTEGGRPLRFIAPREHAADERFSYELAIARTGEVETRPGNWHDLFNALAWIAFPRAKARLNAQHAAILEEGGEAELLRRGAERDALTLFDESGVVVACAAPELLRLIVDHAWKALFWERRAELAAHARFVAFGHALLEKALDPYPGMIGKAVFLPVDDEFLALPEAARAERTDVLLAAHFASRARFPSPRAMPPVPILGVPGWHPGTERASFYDDADHFRPASRPRGA